MAPVVHMVLAMASTRAASAAYSYDSYGECVYPEVCHEPKTAFKRVLPVGGRFQWDESGGFCGSLSIQTMALTHGAWLSQDEVRKANRGGLCFGHTDEFGGCEVGPENYGLTARNLKLRFDEWDFTQPAPQASAFKRWVKAHLVKGEPVMWAPMLKNDKHMLYGRLSDPGNGRFDHHEPIIGIGSHHDLSDPEVYDDDWLVHYSDYDLQPCYRNFSSLEDDERLEGNCRNARKKQAVMYPCFPEDVTYGLSVAGFDMFGASSAPRVYLDVDRPDEPRVRLGHAPAMLQGRLLVKDLTPGQSYVLFRFNSTESLPDGVALDLLNVGYERRFPFTANASSWHFEDPLPIRSNSATYYVVIAADRTDLQIADSLQERRPRAFLVAEERANASIRDLNLDVRPVADPELSTAPAFKSLAALPVSTGDVPVWSLPVAAAAGAALVLVIQRFRRRVVTPGETLLG